MLYIPHGSDESTEAIMLIEIFKTFISHMVQMKVISLFPTPGAPFILYIPHGSDES